MLCARVFSGVPLKSPRTTRTPPRTLATRGTLDLYAGMGQIARGEAGLLEAVFALARPEGHSKQMIDSLGETLTDHIAAEGEDAAPAIDWGNCEPCWPLPSSRARCDGVTG